LAIALVPNGLGRLYLWGHLRAPLQTVSQFIKRRALGRLTKLAEQVVGK
jgi:hypothetical protein